MGDHDPRKPRRRATLGAWLIAILAGLSLWTGWGCGGECKQAREEAGRAWDTAWVELKGGARSAKALASRRYREAARLCSSGPCLHSQLIEATGAASESALEATALSAVASEARTIGEALKAGRLETVAEAIGFVLDDPPAAPLLAKAAGTANLRNLTEAALSACDGSGRGN